MNLKKGSKGEEVKKIQEKLGLKADGDFGSVTEKALQNWQTKNGILPTGILDEKTMKVMFPEIKKEVAQTKNDTMKLNLEKLKGKIPDSVLYQIPDTAAKFGITTNLRLAHFLAQCDHESGGFQHTLENLNYSADGLKKIFSKYFPGNLNESYAKNPQKIANRVYSSRMGNGDELSGDGFRFRGRGYIQLTGKFNYQIFDRFVEDDIILNPDLVSTKYPLSSAAFFFNNNKLWEICDKGSDEDTITKVSKRVNGGTIGLEDRIKKFKKYYSLLFN
jgi:putative chitinase